MGDFARQIGKRIGGIEDGLNHLLVSPRWMRIPDKRNGAGYVGAAIDVPLYVP